MKLQHWQITDKGAHPLIETSLCLWRHTQRIAEPGTSPVNRSPGSTGCTKLASRQPRKKKKAIQVQDTFSWQITDPHGAKASLPWICASNNEVWAATVAPLCHTRADPRRDFLVVMLLIQQSLPQSPGSVALYYNTHTRAHAHMRARAASVTQ